ncbi:acyl-CoA dehydrogenase C-terminal domain-containing protein [Candidatus Viadribacter manganicus]|uniref:3-methylmercaptopropionyl-CoA dehydrogenase n=1 Tax=Candidatus Viadribacter manganicus TaxID=1759059 RepID=A0A1B1AKV0_9PROT|nr:acyl-CoA dehydrogenase C-terminal domain-containing protein [Candidatus Viadribacter manganicus]ANP47161.1 acyl-CoA dehydrogenase [Candidatus Viadribacter manganicus]
MPTYTAPLREYRFLLKDVLDIERYSNLPTFADAPIDLIDQVLEEGAKFCEGVLAPLNKVGDEHGCVRRDDGSVTTPPGFKEAYKQLVEAGWPALSCDPNYGGQGMPHVISLAWSEMVSSSNMAFGMYPGLSHGAYEAIHHHGSDEQKQTYLPKLVTGEWTGTMNLTEPHCGTDLGMLRTKAIPQTDGSYRITGQKIFISAGEHDLASNIIHLVLARIEGAPQGTKGISLFIVPKFVLDKDGNPGKRNGVVCGKIEEKMGIHGNSTCVLNYDDATGYLVGQENKGLQGMFVMMNVARLGVGLQGLSQSEVAYQNGVAYAKDRLQGRSITGAKNPDGPADPIIVHPDIRRMLMDAKAFNEGARAFAFWTAIYGDLLLVSPDEKVREKAEDYMGLMTPVLKSYLTDKGYANATNCQQIFGGHGYIEEHGMSQFVRDARIAMIYEGANGIQALDLVGRKLGANGGRAIFAFFNEIDDFVHNHEDDAELKEFVEALQGAKAQMQDGAMWLMQNGMSNFDNAGAASHDFLNVVGLTALTYMWTLQAKAAYAAKKNGGAGDPYYDTKIATGRYFITRMLPDAAAHLAKLKSGAGPVMALTAEQF